MYKRMESRWKKFTGQEKIILPLMHLFLLILSIWVLLPMIYVFFNSFKSVKEFNDSTLALPKVWAWKNYANAFSLTYRNTDILGMFANSLIFTLTFSVANVFSSCMSAYILSKYSFRGRKIIYSVAIVVQILPLFGTAGAGYLLASNLGIVDNIWLMWITACGGFDYTFLIVYSYFKNVSWDYAEAAFIDGAGNFYVFLRIMLPMVSPAVFTMWLSAVISLWGDYMTPMIYLQSHPTLSAGLYNLKTLSAFTEGGTTMYFAALIISVIPVLILYVFTQNKIFSINLEGGIKA